MMHHKVAGFDLAHSSIISDKLASSFLTLPGRVEPLGLQRLNICFFQELLHRSETALKKWN